MSAVREPAPGPYVVATAWHCSACEVEGRTVAATEVTCWNCDGQVTVTARPALRVDDV
jgi:DnaJ-class molecular chaperone